jgi:hypothetical protein
MSKKKIPNYYCLNCVHSGAVHSGPKMRCGGLDAAGDTCDCSPFVADIHRPPMKESTRTRKKAKRTAEKKVTRYRIMSDGDHDYFISVGKELEFEAWVEQQENGELTDDNFEENRIDGTFTFTDPRCE